MQPRHRTTGQSGATLVEVIVAAGLMGTILLAGFVQMNAVTTVKAAMERGQAIDIIELSTRPLLARDDVIRASAAKSTASALKTCLAGTTCTDNGAYTIDMYLPGQSKAFTGASVDFDGSGTPCNVGIKSNCKAKYRQTTTVITSCLPSGSSCTSPFGITVRFTITDIKTGTKLREDYVDRRLTSSDLIGSSGVACPTGQILRGIGMRGEALCVAKNDIEYEDGTFAGNYTINVKPGDCRLRNTRPSDQNFVSGYNKTGDLICKPKEW